MALLLTDALIDELHAFRIGMMSRLVDSLKRTRPEAAGTSVGSGFATFPGQGDLLTQAYGIAHRNAEFDLASLDDFYRGRADNWELIVTPFDSPLLLRKAAEIGYLPDHFESVLAQMANKQAFESPDGVEIEVMTEDLTEWARVSEAAWQGVDDLADEISPITEIMLCSPATKYLARFNGVPAATAGLVEINGKFLFGGASTLPKFRNKGLQSALTQRRLYDAGPGSFVQVVALPGSQSHRNLQRVGFSPLYSKLVMFRRAQD